MIKFLRNSAKPLKKPWLLFALGLATTILILTTTARMGPLIFIGDFETGDFSRWKLELCCKHSGEIVNSPTRVGTYAVKFTLNRNDPLVKKGKRAELKRYGVSRMGSEYWYGFSIYLPNDWIEDREGEIVTQWHDNPDFWFGEGSKRPPVSLSISNNNWGITNVWDSSLVTKTNETTIKQKLWSGTFTRGVWTDWVFHIKWSYKSDGLIEVWKDGVHIVNKHGPNTYNDWRSPFFKIGSYKYAWKSPKSTSIVNKRIIYYDEVRIGNASARYADVTPKLRSAL